MDFIVTILGITFALFASGALTLVILFLSCDIAAEQEKKRALEEKKKS
jgi:hypothetical protein